MLFHFLANLLSHFLLTFLPMPEPYTIRIPVLATKFHLKLLCREENPGKQQFQRQSKLKTADVSFAHELRGPIEQTSCLLLVLNQVDQLILRIWFQGRKR